MSLLIYFLIAAGCLGAIYLISRLVRALRTCLTFRGQRIVSWPENHCPAAVRVAAGKGADEPIPLRPENRRWLTTIATF